MSEHIKESTMPPVGGWATGAYLNTCRKCKESYIGDKRSWNCADCAYAFVVEENAKLKEANGWYIDQINMLKEQLKVAREGLERLEQHDTIAQKYLGKLKELKGGE